MQVEQVTHTHTQHTLCITEHGTTCTTGPSPRAWPACQRARSHCACCCWWCLRPFCHARHFCNVENAKGRRSGATSSNGALLHSLKPHKRKAQEKANCHVPAALNAANDAAAANHQGMLEPIGNIIVSKTLAAQAQVQFQCAHHSPPHTHTVALTTPLPLYTTPAYSTTHLSHLFWCEEVEVVLQGVKQAVHQTLVPHSKCRGVLQQPAGQQQQLGTHSQL